MTQVKRCAEDPLQGEFSLCGVAFDALDDDIEPYEIVKPGQTVTCEDCKRCIREIKEYFPRGFKRV